MCSVDQLAGDIASLVPLGMRLQEVREEKHLQHGEDDKKLNEYDGPQRTPQAHITKALVVEVEHSVGKTAFLHRHKKKDGFSLQI